MARIDNHIFTQLKGRIAGMVFFTRWGQTYVRKVAGKVSVSRTPLQQLQRSRMSSAVTLYGVIRPTILVTAWQEAARGKACSGYNLFIQKNIRVFDGQGCITDYTRLHFTAGCLPVCDCPVAVYDPQEQTVQLRWENRSPLSKMRMTDLLGMVVLYEDDGFILFTPAQLQCRRSECAARFSLPAAKHPPRWVYVFFTDTDEKIFSDDIACPLNK